jgi:Icc-related predicted phosphoesterase
VTNKLAAVADVHSPIFFSLFKEALSAVKEASLFLLAGDVVYRGDFEECKRVVATIKETLRCPIVGVFGNEEYEEIKPRLKQIEEITWLDDEYKIFEVDDIRVKIVGSRGSLLKPTSWQLRNLPDIRKLYVMRLNKLRELLAKSDDVDYTVLLLHYSPTFSTLVGEKPSIYPFMGDPRLERILRETKPKMCIHGHAHRSKVKNAVIGETTVYNVSLPAAGRITEINVEEIAVTKQRRLYNFK